MISAIVAVDENWGIGFNGELLEKIPNDLKHFKELTIGDGNNAIVMGKKTYNSTKRLPSRKNIIISRHGACGEDYGEEQCIHYANSNISFMTLDYFLKKCNFYHLCCCKNIFIIGGGQIYKELLPLCDRVYVTKIFKEHENVDTYFPNLDEPEEWNTWKVVEQSKTYIYNDIMYQFWTYDRVN